ncbi:MAG: DUF4738 domain-containing protein [Prevotella sp.]|nr:DUF4738 domain-containing protein [Prevotella sp.]
MRQMTSKIAKCVLAVLAVAAMASCSEKKKPNVIIVPKAETPKPSAPVRMSEYTHRDDVEWIGKTYKVEVHRFVADSLPMVKDEQGTKYYDNLIRIKVIRPDGTEFFNRLFSKKAFNDYLDANTRDNGVLLGIVFDRAEGDNLLFGASVGSADKLSDEYIPMIVTLSRMGNVSIARDTQLDSIEPLDANAEDEEEGV